MYEIDNGLAKLLKNIRTEKNISLDELSMGLMSVSQLSRVENGERSIDKNIRDRLLERLGIAKEQYDNLLDICDYEEWSQKRPLSALEVNMLSETLFYGNEAEYLHKYRALRDSIIFSHYIKYYYFEKIYRNKLEALNQLVLSL